jgi:hypothetical protein
MPSMPKVRPRRARSAPRAARRLVAQQRAVQDAHERHGGRDLALPRRWLQQARRRRSPAAAPSSGVGAPALRQVAAERRRRSCRYFISGCLGRLVERQVGELVVGIGMLEAVAELAQASVSIFFCWCVDVLALADLAHAVALDGLGQDHGGLPGVRHRGRRRRRSCAGRGRRGSGARSRRRSCARPSPAAPGTCRRMLAHVGAVLGLVVLVFAVDRFLHPRSSRPLLVAREQRVPAEPQITLITFQPAPRKSPRAPG